MKIRNSFVSNSSSCSFVLLGFSKNELDDEFIKQIESEYEDGLREFSEKNKAEYYSEEKLIGYILAEGSDDSGMNESKFSISELIDKIDSLSTLFKISTQKIKLITGERCC